VLVTGFEPFEGGMVNPSQRLVEALAADPPREVELSTAVLPVAYARAADGLRAARDRAPRLSRLLLRRYSMSRRRAP